MNYQRIYDQIIDRAKNRISPIGYYETHHIVPKCLGGSDDPENLANLTAREHFICHWLLTRIYPEDRKLSYALWCMCNMKAHVRHGYYTVSSRLYEEARIKFSIANSIQMKGRIFSDETRAKLKKPKSEETKLKMRKPKSPEHIENMKGRSVSEETRKKIGESNRGKVRSPEIREKYRYKKTPEHIQKIMENRKNNGFTVWNKGKVTWTEDDKIKMKERWKEYWATVEPSVCMHCGYESRSKSVITRYHNGNCKHKS
jgi:predicted Zn-ribbon and HTH transcriptional regulator